MSKRKRASIGKAPVTPSGEGGAEDTADDTAVKDDMVHVTPDLLAGSPDIFAGKRTEASEPEAERGAPEVTSQPIEPAEATTYPTHEETPGLAPEPPATPPPPLVNAVSYPSRPRGGGSTSAIGIVLVVIGLFALAVVLSGVDFTQSGWPLFIIIPGLTLLVVGFVSVGAAATIPGGLLTMLGVVLAYTSSTDHWPVWAYAWSLVVPGGIGLGMYLQALRDHDQESLRTGRTLLFVSLIIFLIGFVLFESILGISGRDAFGPVGKAAKDGLPGGEGTFSICSFWMVEALARAGYVDEARLMFEKMLSYGNHLGLFSEEIGQCGQSLGNFPQALTHLGLISAAFNLDRALDEP